MSDKKQDFTEELFLTGFASYSENYRKISDEVQPDGLVPAVVRSEVSAEAILRAVAEMINMYDTHFRNGQGEH